MPAEVPFPITGDDDANRLLAEDPLALTIGMLLDQQVPMEWAFASPAKLRDRLGGRLDATEIAAMGPDAVAAVFSEKPALHRFPGSMGRRAHALCQHLVDHHHGDAADVWEGATDAADLSARVRALPGFGEEKAGIFIALLAKRFGRAPEGWEAYAGPFADAEPRSVADVADADSLLDVRAWKKAKKAAGKTKQD
jgi:uncharacterized HhH-GPD family protein